MRDRDASRFLRRTGAVSPVRRPALRDYIPRMIDGNQRVRSPLRCTGCGKVVGVYEPAWVEHPDGTLHSSALMHLDEKTRRNAHAIWHAGCFIEPRGS